MAEEQMKVFETMAEGRVAGLGLFNICNTTTVVTRNMLLSSLYLITIMPPADILRQLFITALECMT